MTQIDDEDLERNWLWLAIDQLGQLAAFQSFGHAPIPPSVCQSVEDAERVDTFIESTLLRAPGYCIGEVCQETTPFSWWTRFPLEKYRNDYEHFLAGAKQVASCGLFVYYPSHQIDQRVGYIQVAFPSVPRTLASLPSSVQFIVQRSCFEESTFDELLHILADRISSVGS